MIRFLILAAFLHPFVWNAGLHPSGSFIVWAGTLVRFDCGPHVAIEWDADGLPWTAAWVDQQDDADDFEAWSWCVDGRVGGETRVVTP